ncbi:uncharacterized protein LOC123554489 [Mercenaria mercenaria]|uniref:uncharacterized protein LOC123554489 n=1 Tax=Mercenaria mercenaria TaxID=6596 RepID=UPI00234E8468|nr:uncharacterized protein LOC123554489 [Mercenaria mercenaria]
MLVSFLILAVFLAVTDGIKPHGNHASAGTEEFQITYQSTNGNLEWTINGNSDVAKAIKNHKWNIKTVPSTDTGYRGYIIKHIAKGKPLHTWQLVKCENPSLEIGILEQTADIKVVRKYLKVLKAALNTCTRKAKSK